MEQNSLGLSNLTQYSNSLEELSSFRLNLSQNKARENNNNLFSMTNFTTGITMLPENAHNIQTVGQKRSNPMNSNNSSELSLMLSPLSLLLPTQSTVSKKRRKICSESSFTTIDQNYLNLNSNSDCNIDNEANFNLNLCPEEKKSPVKELTLPLSVLIELLANSNESTPVEICIPPSTLLFADTTDNSVLNPYHTSSNNCQKLEDVSLITSSNNTTKSNMISLPLSSQIGIPLPSKSLNTHTTTASSSKIQTTASIALSEFESQSRLQEIKNDSIWNNQLLTTLTYIPPTCDDMKQSVAPAGVLSSSNLFSSNNINSNANNKNKTTSLASIGVESINNDQCNVFSHRKKKMSEEEARSRRLEQNREAARRSRERKKKYTEILENEYYELRHKFNELRDNILKLYNSHGLQLSSISTNYEETKNDSSSLSINNLKNQSSSVTSYNINPNIINTNHNKLVFPSFK